MIKKIAFVVYPVENILRARRFYETILGLVVGKSTAGGEWIEYDLPQGGCFAITTLTQEIIPKGNIGANVAFEIENLEDFIAELKKKEVKFKRDVYDSPVCKIAVIFDSEGNTIILHQLKF
ncbi:VOC family protein [Legionella pneumophila]|nr:VOC family protein [Legionella pneumophila]MDW8907008.1 VOC family protein [Legionella pneumophila]HAU1477913.1 VOC family protein [Legionella pneumophila]